MPALAMLALTVSLDAATPARAELHPMEKPRAAPSVPGIRVCKRAKSANSVAPNTPRSDPEQAKPDDDTDPPPAQREQNATPGADMRGPEARGLDAAGSQKEKSQDRR